MIDNQLVTHLLEDSLYAIAKSDRKDDIFFLPFAIHAVDSMMVASMLLSRYWSDFERNWLMETLQVDEAELKKLVCFLVGIHDIGKLQYEFQKQISGTIANDEIEVYNKWLNFGENITYNPDCNHTVVGEAILKNYEIGNEIFQKMIAFHHARIKGKQDLEIDAYEDEIYGEEIDDVYEIWRMVIQDIQNLAGLKSLEKLKDMSWEVFIYLTGMIQECDWIASDQKLFPLVKSYEEVLSINFDQRVRNGFKTLKYSDPWQSRYFEMDEKDFIDSFGFKPRKLQKELIKIGNNCMDLGLVICEAPMGEGKTEGALALADILASQKGCGGLFIGLPTQTNTNAMFPRIEKWSLHMMEKNNEKSSITLAHSKAKFNQEFAKLKMPKNEEETRLYVQSWTDRSQLALLPNFVVSTVDQFLMSALKYKGLFFRHIGMMGKVIIIDEVHAYDYYMDTYLKRALNWAGLYGIPVILLSATLPSEKRNSFIEAYLLGKQKKSKLDMSISVNTDFLYPVITYTDGEIIKTNSIKQTAMNQKVILKFLNPEDNLSTLLQNKISNGGCAAVIVNTVSRAQELTEQLKNDLPDDYEIVLFHSGFTWHDRKRVEEKILKRVGKNSNKIERERFIVVSTQLLEASLDLDFDVMFSELASADSLLQRMGRLHRHKIHDLLRPKETKKPVFYIMNAQPDTWSQGTKEIYSSWILWRTLENLSEFICIPEDIPYIIENTFKPISEEENKNIKLRELEKEYTNKKKEQEIKATSFLLSFPDQDIEVSNILTRTQSVDNENIAVQSVRDILASIDVIPLKKGIQSVDKLPILKKLNFNKIKVGKKV
ncbi:CRISPR-associated helicase cas3 [Firmicutes bacterium M10-2]|nr:CRISPR-associated helicase cas3 [Firmicutes bacterium M10-2]